MFLTPSMPESSASSSCVMRVSMTSALAPGYPTWTWTVGATVSGFSRTVRSRNDIAPIATSSMLKTVAKTGRLTEMSDSHIARPSAASLGRGCRRHRALRARALADRGLFEPHASAFAQLDDALDDDGVAFAQAAEHLDDAEAPAADFDLLLVHGVAVDAIDVSAVLNLKHRALGNDERGALGRDDVDRQQHAGPQGSVLVVDVRAHGDRARHGVDARADGPHRSFELAVREAHALRDDCRAGRHRADERFGDREVELDEGDVVDRRDRRVRREQRAGADLTEAEQAAERRLDQAITQPRDDAVETRAARSGSRAGDVELGSRRQAAGAQVFQPAQLALRVVEIRARLREQSFLFLIRELDQHGARLDVVAVLEIHASHGVRDFRRQRDRLVGLRRAERLYDVINGIALCAPDRDERRLSLRPPTTETACRRTATCRRGERCARASIAAALFRDVPHHSATQSEGEHDQQSVFHERLPSCLGS